MRGPGVRLEKEKKTPKKTLPKLRCANKVSKGSTKNKRPPPSSLNSYKVFFFGHGDYEIMITT